MLELTLPLPPSVNTYYKKYRNKLIISPAGQEFRKNVIALVDTVANIERFTKDDRLSLDVNFYPPTTEGEIWTISVAKHYRTHSNMPGSIQTIAS